MKCPCCRLEMDKGYLQTGTGIAWTKEIHRTSLLSKGKDLKQDNNVYSGCNFVAYICKKCKTITIDYSNKDVQEG